MHKMNLGDSSRIQNLTRVLSPVRALLSMILSADSLLYKANLSRNDGQICNHRRITYIIFSTEVMCYASLVLYPYFTASMILD